MTMLSHTWFMTMRHVRTLMRQPWYIAFSLLQPLIYLVLFGQLFKRVIELPDFAATSYIVFLTPGIVVVSAFFGAGWTGMGIIQDLDRGVLDRFLVSPASRAGLVAGRLVQLAIVTVIQALIIIGVGFAMGARFDGGVLGLIMLIIGAILLAAPVGALSCGMALLLRKEESVIGAVQFILLPASYLSAVFIDLRLAPGWIRTVARFNPLNWSVQIGRSVLSDDVDWGLVLSRMGLLALVTVVAAWLATRAFHTYQRSV